MKVAFCHPDLGLGGAERLVVDAAHELSVTHKHSVDIYTAYYNPKRCFAETKAGNFKVIVAGGWFPRQILGKCTAMCAIVRCITIALRIIFLDFFRPKAQRYNIIFVDQVSAVVPLFTYFSSAKVLFYCHFPDLLLSKRESALHKVYRVPLDLLEQVTTGMADLLLVNSYFTAGVFGNTFKYLHSWGIKPDILYPAVSILSESELFNYKNLWQQLMLQNSRMGKEWLEFLGQRDSKVVFLSINRFERKKGIELAPKALKLLLDDIDQDEKGAVLILAGGYDDRVKENVEHLNELKALIDKLQLNEYVKFFPSFTDEEREILFAACDAIIYTPQHEHFGIVPIEAMAHEKPVIAVHNGGPVESVGNAGILCEATPTSFAQAMKVLMDDAQAKKLGEISRARVVEKFSRLQFGNRLNDLIQDLVKQKTQSKGAWLMFMALSAVGFSIIAFFGVFWGTFKKNYF
eukprot:TRINITY_DN39752_c0_g1_i2.p1 TRINITY_DN39752_c0_g1~~TRINITY_DN39752_c0_g1_i2.p1  ORF type:complete len:461 (-),score=43.98 TRINITY_DN39752_c0_g1_i2:273-1655(-)